MHTPFTSVPTACLNGDAQVKESGDRHRQALECEWQSSDRLWRTQDSAFNSVPWGGCEASGSNSRVRSPPGSASRRQRPRTTWISVSKRGQALHLCLLRQCPSPSSFVPSVPSVHSPLPSLYKRVLRYAEMNSQLPVFKTHPHFAQSWY